MDVRAMESFTSLLAIIVASGAIVLVIARSIAPKWNPASDFVRSVNAVSLWLAWLVASVATAGSLYFSEVADYVPCRLCWFQRICMYPLAGILLVGAVRRDRGVRWYALPLLIAGAALSSYHYLIEWRPSLDGGACTVGPSCTDVWFRSHGFVTLAFMALAGFVAIAALLFVTPVDDRADRRED